VIESIVVALIAAAPPTVAAVALLKKATRTERQVTPGNGVKLASMVETIAVLSQGTARRLQDHVENPEAHLVD